MAAFAAAVLPVPLSGPCPSATGELSQYLAGLGTEKQRARIALHIPHCGICSAREREHRDDVHAARQRMKPRF